MDELKTLLAQKAAIEKKIEEVSRSARAEAVARVRALMAEFGLTMADVSTRGKGRGAKRGATGAKVAAKYRNKATGETWSGRGLRPNWLKAALSAGKKLEDFKV